MSSNDEISESIKVFIRERPYSDEELLVFASSSSSGAIHIGGGAVCYKSNEFQFDAFLDSNSTQNDLYEAAAKPIVESKFTKYRID